MFYFESDILSIWLRACLWITTSAVMLYLMRFEKVSWTPAGFILSFMCFWMGLSYSEAFVVSQQLDKGIVVYGFKVEKKKPMNSKFRTNWRIEKLTN